MRNCRPLHQWKHRQIGCQVPAQGSDYHRWVPTGVEHRRGLLTPDTVTRHEQTSRQLHLHRACYPVWYPEPRGIESHQWQTDVSIVYPASEIPCALTCSRLKGGQPHPIWLEDWFEIESDPVRRHDRCSPGLEGWPWTYQHDEDFVRPKRPRRP